MTSDERGVRTMSRRRRRTGAYIEVVAALVQRDPRALEAVAAAVAAATPEAYAEAASRTRAPA